MLLHRGAPAATRSRRAGAGSDGIISDKPVHLEVQPLPGRTVAPGERLLLAPTAQHHLPHTAASTYLCAHFHAKRF